MTGEPGQVRRQRRRRRAASRPGAEDVPIQPAAAQPGAAEVADEPAARAAATGGQTPTPATPTPATPTPASPAPATPTPASPTPARPTPTVPAKRSTSRRGRSDPAERGLRELVGPGPSQLDPNRAMRARDANRPTDADLAEAERDVVIVRRNWKPPRS